MKGYGQFCPVAKTAEIFAQRWTPLVIRELCFGPRRFNEVHSGVPLMSRALLVQRLAELEEAGVVATQPLAQGKLYALTPAGVQMGELIGLMSDWGQRHGQGRIAVSRTGRANWPTCRPPWQPPATAPSPPSRLCAPRPSPRTG